jgi:hypothetical protein
MKACARPGCRRDERETIGSSPPNHSITLSARTNDASHGHTHRLSGLEVDHRLELGCLLSWDMGDLAASKEAYDLWRLVARLLS